MPELPKAPISAYNLESVTIKNRNIVGATSCTVNNETVDLSGSSATDVNGQMIWKLSDFICTPIFGLKDPTSFVATPISGNNPTYLTTTITLQATPTDLIVQVFSWDKQGNPAPNIKFSWRCRLGYIQG